MTIKMSVKLFLTIFLVGFFLFLTPVKADGGIIINEICPTGCASSGYQWVEIYNNSSTTIDLFGWKFWGGETNHGLELFTSLTQQDYLIDAGEYAIITQDDLKFFSERVGVSVAVFDSSWGTLNKGGEIIGLKGADGNLVEEFVYSAVASNSLERKDSAVSASDVDNWCEHESGNTIGAANVCPALISEISFPTSDTGSLTPTTTPQLKINEFIPNPNSGEEWIEIYNSGASTADLIGWKLFDAVGAIAAPTGTIEAGGFFVVELFSSKLNNTGGDSVILKDTTDTTIDSVSYGEAAKGNSIARSVDGAGSFAETTTLTKNAANQITAPVLSADSASSPQASSGQGGGGYSAPASFHVGTIVINEIVSDQADEANEFVELYNHTNAVVDLDGWWLEDGGETRTKIEGVMLPRAFFVVDNPNGNLNNSGDLIALFDPSGKTIDQLTYGNWNDGNLSDNAPAAGDPLSLARKSDGRDTDNDYYDFALTGQITKGSGNKIISINQQGEKISEAIMISSPIILNEVFPNPKGSDTAEEFIELRNLGDSQTDLAGWQLGDAGEKKYKLNQGVIPAGGYIAFKRALTGIALNNSGQEEVKLYNQTGALVDKIKYEGAAVEDQSYARRDDGVWKWTIKTTSGKENIIEGKSAA